MAHPLVREGCVSRRGRAASAASGTGDNRGMTRRIALAATGPDAVEAGLSVVEQDGNLLTGAADLGTPPVEDMTGKAPFGPAEQWRELVLDARSLRRWHVHRTEPKQGRGEAFEADLERADMVLRRRQANPHRGVNTVAE